MTQFCFPTLKKKAVSGDLGIEKEKLKEEFWALVKPSEKRQGILVLILLKIVVDELSSLA